MELIVASGSSGHWLVIGYVGFNEKAIYLYQTYPASILSFHFTFSSFFNLTALRIATFDSYTLIPKPIPHLTISLPTARHGLHRR